MSDDLDNDLDSFDDDSNDGRRFYANPNAPSDRVPCRKRHRIPGTPFVFAASAGTVPPYSPLNIGQEAINQTTNESWFVNQSFQWQQEVGA